MLKAVFESEEVPYFFLFEPRPSKQEEADFLPYELFGLGGEVPGGHLDGNTLGGGDPSSDCQQDGHEPTGARGAHRHLQGATRGRGRS